MQYKNQSFKSFNHEYLHFYNSALTLLAVLSLLAVAVALISDKMKSNASISKINENSAMPIILKLY